MDISDLTLRLIIILIPGTISSLIIETIAIHKKWTQFRLALSAVLLGVLSFSVLQILYWICQLFIFKCINFEYYSYYRDLEIWNSIFNKNSEINPIEIILCLVVSIPLGYSTGYLIQFKIVNRVAQYCGFSNRFGDDSLFSHYLNKSDIDWVYIRDIKNGLTYRGQVHQFAEEGMSKEIVLLNVTVYDYVDSNEGYKLPRIYLRFQDRDIIIEEAIPTN